MTQDDSNILLVLTQDDSDNLLLLILFGLFPCYFDMLP